MNERDYVNELARQIKYKFKRVWTHSKPSASKPFCSRLEQKLGYLPILQPEIDICFLDNVGVLNAIEVKLFRSNQASFRLPFYEGLGQGLALHRYGFDHVGVWFIFESEVFSQEIEQYGAAAWYFLRNQLKLPLDFTYFRVEQSMKSFTFHTLQYESDRSGRELLPISHPRFEIHWRQKNPIKGELVPRTIRMELEKWLQAKD